MNFHRFQRSDGSVFISASMAAGILAILLGAILTYMGNEYNMNLRSHYWNQSLHLAEAGVEIGFAQLAYYGTNDFTSANGWSTPYWWLPSYHTKNITNFTDATGKVVGTIAITVQDFNTNCPSITSVGTCTKVSRGPTLSRAVQAVLYTSTMFPAAVAAKGTITLSGASYVDSFDSTDPNKSTGGLYDPTKRQANGNVATDATIAKSDSFSGGMAIYGNAWTGPGGTVAMSSSSVGPTFDTSLRSTTVADGEAKGYIRHDFQVTIPDAVLPSSLSSAPSVPGGQINQSGGTGTLTSGSWQASALTISGGGTLVINGTVNLYVSGVVNASGGSSIIVSPGSSLTVYAGNKVTLSGGGVINNTGLAKNNQWFGLPTSPTFTYSGGSAFVGTIYAPEADIIYSGGSMGIGALVGDTVTFSGGSGWHYDESLGNSGGSGYLLGSWKELKMVGGVWQ